MNLYCIYLLSNFYVSQPTIFHECKLQQVPKVTTVILEVPARRETQTQRNIREALEYPILVHLEQQNTEPADGPSITITF